MTVRLSLTSLCFVLLAACTPPRNPGQSSGGADSGTADAGSADAGMTPCQASSDCGKHVCSPLLHVCVQCNADVDCSSGQSCQDNNCVGQGPVVTFVSPQPMPGSSAPVAVSGTSNLTLKVVSNAGLLTVTVTYDSGKPLANFPGTATSFSQPVMWSTLGAGTHHLLAMATDTNHNSGAAMLDVNVGCTSNADCPQGGACNTMTGVCGTPVNAGDDCDDTHICPPDQGCFPGTCGAAPRKCRPGCSPGTDSQPADPCAPQDGHTAYCSPLPADQVTSQNKGGGCAPSDDCDIVKQDCPDLPLDRTKSVSSSNPAVPHTCIPASPSSPKANECMPAGTTPLHGTGCDLACGNNTTNCAKGLICVMPVDSTNTPTGAPACQKQCSDPWIPSGASPTPPQAPDCPANEYCGGLEGAGGAPFATGVCEPM